MSLSFPELYNIRSTFVLIIATESVVAPEVAQMKEAEGVNSQPGSLWDRKGK